MKIAYLLGSLNRGGTETLALDSFQHNCYSNFQTIGIYRKDGVLTESFLNTKLPLYKVSPKNLFDLFYILRLRKLILSEKINIIHAQQVSDAFYAILASLMTNTKIVLTVHAFDFSLKRQAKILYKMVFLKLDKIIFVSEVQKDYYKKKYHLNDKKIAVIYNGISF